MDGLRGAVGRPRRGVAAVLAGWSGAAAGGLGALAVALVLASCGGGGGRRGEPSDSSIRASTSSTSGPPTTPAPSARPVPPGGSAAFTVVGVTLAEPGLRVLVEASGGTMEVVARGLTGGSNGVLVCPVGGVAGPPPATGCVVATDGRAATVALDGGANGVLLRAPEGAAGASVRASEVTLIYVPGGDRITVVTPPVAPSETPGDCPGGVCEMAFELSPTGSGTFVLDADGRGARPQLTVQSGLPSGPSRVLSIVEGGGRLTVRATVDGRSDARVMLRNQGRWSCPRWRSP